jgi:isocitrate dehydrogenase (NAD+)
MNKANPTALLLSATLMLDHLGEHDVRTKIEAALRTTIESGVKTYDLGGTATTSEYAEAIAAALKG